MTTALEGVNGEQHALTALYPRERHGTHCTGGWVGLRASLYGSKISPPPGFDPRTVQPLASRYTEYATRPAVKCIAYVTILCVTVMSIELL